MVVTLKDCIRVGFKLTGFDSEGYQLRLSD